MLETVRVKQNWRPSVGTSAAAAATMPSPIRSSCRSVGRCSQFSDVWTSFVACCRNSVPAMSKGGEGTNDFELNRQTLSGEKSEKKKYTPSLSFDFIQDHRTINFGKSHKGLCVENKTQIESRITLYSLYIGITLTF